MTAKGDMDVYPGRPFHIVTTNFGRADVNLPEHQKVAEIFNAPPEVTHIENECFSYSGGAKAT